MLSIESCAGLRGRALLLAVAIAVPASTPGPAFTAFSTRPTHEAQLTPSTSRSRSSPVTVSRRVTPVTALSPLIETTSLFQTNSILSFSNARSCMILDARSWSRRWIT